MVRGACADASPRPTRPAVRGSRPGESDRSSPARPSSSERPQRRHGDSSNSRGIGPTTTPPSRTLVCASVVLLAETAADGVASPAGSDDGESTSARREMLPVAIARVRSMRPTQIACSASIERHELQLHARPLRSDSSPEFPAGYAYRAFAGRAAAARPSSSSVKRTRVPAGFDDLVKMKMRSSLTHRQYLLTKVGEIGAANDDPQHDDRLQRGVVGAHGRPGILRSTPGRTLRLR